MSDLPSLAFPRVTIQFCTQCKWNLRAAYFAQELLSTFSLSLGEVALQPSTGGVFTVSLYTTSGGSTISSDLIQASTSQADGPALTVQKHVLWDRKTEGGFPETKELKRRVRDIIEPGRDLGHVDGKKKPTTVEPTTAEPNPETSTITDITATTTPGADTITQEPVRESLPKHAQEPEPEPEPEPTKQELNSRGKIVITGSGDGNFGFCKPGDEDCG